MMQKIMETDNMATAIAQFKDMPVTKQEQNDFVKKLVEEMLSGTAPILDTLLVFKAMQNVIDSVLDNNKIKAAVLEEAIKYPSSEFTYKGVKITKVSRKTYDYKGCKDEKFESLKEQLEKRQEVLKLGVDTDTGELVTKATTKTSNFLKIEFEKAKEVQEPQTNDLPF